MLVTSTIDIITKKVLNETSGELESKDFRQIKETKRVKGGYANMYKSYEEAIEQVISSKLDYTILLEFKNQFTYQRVECVLSPAKVGKKLGCSERKALTVLQRMIQVGLVMKVDKWTYRLNPYMVLPYHSDGETLQREWTELVQVKKDLSEATPKNKREVE